MPSVNLPMPQFVSSNVFTPDQSSPSVPAWGQLADLPSSSSGKRPIEQSRTSISDHRVAGVDMIDVDDHKLKDSKEKPSLRTA